MQPCYSRRIEESLWISSQQCLCCSWSFTHIRCSSCSDVLSSMRASKYWSSLERTWTNLHRKSDCHWTLFIYIHIQWTWEKPFVWDPPVLFHRRYANCDLTNIKHYLGAINLRAHTDIIGGATFEAQGYHVTEMLFQPLALKKEYQIPYQNLLFSILCGDLFLVDDVSICNNEYKGEFSTELLEEFANGNGAG